MVKAKRNHKQEINSLEKYVGTKATTKISFSHKELRAFSSR